MALLTPAMTTKHGPEFARKEVAEAVHKLIQAEDYFHGRSREVTKQVQDSIEILDEYLERLDERVQRILDKEKEFSKSVKGVSTSARNSIEALWKANDKIRSTFDPNGTLSMVESITRLADAMDRLAKLERSGELQRVISAFRKGD